MSRSRRSLLVASSFVFAAVLDPAARARAAVAEPKRVPPSSGTFLEGWDEWVLAGPRPPGSLELRLNLGGDRWDNLLQSPASRSPEPVAAARSEARLTARLSRRTPLKSYLELGQLRYDGRPATTAFGAGLAFDGDRHVLHLGTRIERGRPSIDIGDGADVLHDAVALRLRYALRARRFEWSLGGDRLQQRFAAAPFRNGRWHAVQTGLVYLGLSRRLAPELTVGWARNEAAGDSELDLRQARVQLALRYSPTSFAAVTARCEYAHLAFDIARPNAFNFRRRDRRLGWGVQAQFRVTRQASWTLVYDRLQGDSSRVTPAFTAHYLAAGLSVRVGSTNAPPPPPPPAVAPRSSRTPPPAAEPKATLAPAPSPALVATPPEPVQSVASAVRTGAGLRRIESVRRGVEVETTIDGEGLLRCSTLALTAPLRFVVDLEGVSAGAPFAVAVDTDVVAGIRVAPFGAGSPPVSRVVFDLKVPADAQVERDGAVVRVRLRPRDDPSPALEAARRVSNAVR